MIIDTTSRIVDNFTYMVESENGGLGSHFKTRTGMYDVVTTDNLWNAFKKGLVNGAGPNGRPITEDQRIMSNLFEILDHSRMQMLNEDFSGNATGSGFIGVTAQTHAAAMALFGIVMDIYAEPALNEIMTIHTTDIPTYSVERQWIESHQKNTDGTIETYRFPNRKQLIRGREHGLTLLPGENALFSIASTNGGTETLHQTTHKLNRSDTYIYEIDVTDNHSSTNTPLAGGAVNTKTLACTISPNARDVMTPYVVTFKAGPEPAEGVEDTRDVVTCKVMSIIDWDAGNVNLSASFKNETNPDANGTMQYRLVNAKMKTRFSGKRSDLNRVQLSMKRYNYDIWVDIREDFKLELITEDIQDWTAMFKADILKTYMLAIKKQMQYNKDVDVANILRRYEPKMREYGHSTICDLNKFKTAGGLYTPSDIKSVLNGIIGSITFLNGKIHSDFHLYPNVLICGRAVGNMLALMNDQVYNTKDITVGGTYGLASNNVSSFNNQKLVVSDVIADDRIYPLYKPTDDKTHASLVDVIHRPLYAAEEMDQSVKVTYIRSRTTIDVIRDESFGYVEMKNFEDIMPVTNFSS
jgi:hypothetical protein